MWDYHNNLTKAVGVHSGINNVSPLGNVLFYVRQKCGHMYFFFSGFKYVIYLPDSSQKKKISTAWRLQIFPLCIIHLRCSVMKSFPLCDKFNSV